MKNDKETRQKLLVSAKKEFMEKGYVKASLRNICKNTGVTTGALYFFFKDKEDLFGSLIREPLETLYQFMKEHYVSESNYVVEEKKEMRDFQEDRDMMEKIIRFMYQHREEFLLLIEKSQGSVYENFADRFIEVTQKHYRLMADRYSDYLHKPRVDDYSIHWISHMEIDVFIHMLTHEPLEEEALKHSAIIIKFMIAGWLGLFQ